MARSCGVCGSSDLMRAYRVDLTLTHLFSSFGTSMLPSSSSGVYEDQHHHMVENSKCSPPLANPAGTVGPLSSPDSRLHGMHLSFTRLQRAMAANKIQAPRHQKPKRPEIR